MFQLQQKSLGEQHFDLACALLAILAPAAYGYGTRIWLLAGTAFAVSLLTEWGCLYVRKQTFTRDHLDAGLHGIILMLMLPASVPLSLLIMSCIFAIIFGRQLFGGRENPVVHPAAAGFCFALLNQRAAVTMFPKAFTSIPLRGAAESTLTEGVSAAFNRGFGFAGYPTDWLIGLPNQPVGTGSVVLLAVVAVVLILRRSASGWVILPAAAFVCFSGIAFGYFRNPAEALAGSCLSNQMLFSIIFLHGHPDYAPKYLGGMLYGVILSGAAIILTRLLYVTDAPVMLAVILSPAALTLRNMMQAYLMPKGGAADAERNKKTAVPESTHR